MIETDVLVIGAGPSGSTAAKHAALGGAKVIMIDKKSEIGVPKRCAEGVTIKGLNRVGVDFDERFVTSTIKEIKVVSPNGSNLSVKTSEIEPFGEVYVLERKIFDKYMAMDAARAGCEIRIKTRATGFKRENEHVIVDVESFGKKDQIKANVVIAADGPESHVARWAGIKQTTKSKEMESGVQYEMCNVKFDKPTCVEIYIGSQVPGGYIWIFPKGEDIANVGLAILQYKSEKSAIGYLNDFVSTNPATKDAQAVELNVGGDPVGGMPKDICADNLLVCGDAAGQVNTLTGAGIITGMVGGMTAGKVAAESIANEDYSYNYLKKYDKFVKDELYDDLTKFKKVQEYLLTFDDDKFDSLIESFSDFDFKNISTLSLVKNLIKFDKKALLKIGKSIFD